MCITFGSIFETALQGFALAAVAELVFVLGIGAWVIFKMMKEC